MKNKYNLIAMALVLTFAFALTATASSPNYSAYGPGSVNLGGGNLPNDPIYWYNGDFNGVNGLANERNTIVSQAAVYEDFNVTSNITVTGLFSDNLLNTTVTGADWEIRSGISEGNGGTLIASGTTNAPVVTLTGRSGFGFLEYMVQVNGLGVNLAPGHYWMNVTPIGNGGNRSFNSTTSGANCIGTPCGNNQMAFFNSTFFGATFTSTSNLGQPYDFSDGVIAVPEPATVALLTCGLGALGIVAIRRRRA
jgi:PEP-CTERM motif